jgi:glycosyltransferase involved in cell wall biosynthesis
MRILFLISGHRVPSSRFRILQYLPYLRGAGHECAVAASRPPKYRGWPLVGDRASQWPRRLFRWFDLVLCRAGRYDVVVLERELFDRLDAPRWEERFRRAARAMVLDFDDAIFLPHPRKFAAVAAMCEAVIAGNQALAAEAAPHNPRTVVIPTVVDADRYRFRAAGRQGRAGETPVVGWTGMAANLVYLAPIAPALRELARARRYELRIIAERSAPLRRLDLAGVAVRFVPWREASEIEDLQAFDVGLMPLPDEPWARYKCGLKAIQYMACGIATVASGVGVNRQIVRHGENGLLAEGGDAWLARLRALLDDAHLRRRLGDAGRRTVEETYSVRAQLPRLIDVLGSAARDGAARRG